MFAQCKYTGLLFYCWTVLAQSFLQPKIELNLLLLSADSIFSQSFMSRVAAERSRVLGRSMEASAPSSPSHSPSHQPGPCSNTVLLLVIHAGSVLDPNSGMSGCGELFLFVFVFPVSFFSFYIFFLLFFFSLSSFFFFFCAVPWAIFHFYFYVLLFLRGSCFYSLTEEKNKDILQSRYQKFQENSKTSTIHQPISINSYQIYQSLSM